MLYNPTNIGTPVGNVTSIIRLKPSGNRSTFASIATTAYTGQLLTTGPSGPTACSNACVQNTQCTFATNNNGCKLYTGPATGGTAAILGTTFVVRPVVLS